MEFAGNLYDLLDQKIPFVWCLFYRKLCEADLFPSRLYFVLVVGVETWVKNGTKTEQKNVREQNLLQIEQKMGTKSVREQKILAMEIAPNWAQKRDFKVI